MSDNLNEFELAWTNFSYVDMKQCAEFFWKAGVASQQAAHDAEIALHKKNSEYFQSQYLAANERIAYLEGLVAVNADALKFTREELRACQAAIHLSGGFDPLYVIGAQKAMKQADAAISASAETVQAFRDKLTEPLRREVAMLRKHLQPDYLNGAAVCDVDNVLQDAQATAQAYEQEVEARGAVKALEDAGWKMGEEARAILFDMANELRATSKKAG